MANVFPKITRFFSEVDIHVFDIKSYTYRDMMSPPAESGTGKLH